MEVSGTLLGFEQERKLLVARLLRVVLELAVVLMKARCGGFARMEVEVGVEILVNHPVEFGGRDRLGTRSTGGGGLCGEFRHR